jgi:hypothetical protein
MNHDKDLSAPAGRPVRTWLPYFAGGLILWILFGLVAEAGWETSSGLRDCLYTWYYTQLLLFSAVMRFSYRAYVGLSRTAEILLDFFVLYIFLATVLWAIVERFPRLRRFAAWKRALLAWLSLELIYVLTVLLLGFSGLLAE